MKEVKKEDLIFPELSYKIIGTCFDVFNELGFGHKEKFYENALAIEFANKSLTFKKQVKADLIYKGAKIGIYIFDFVIDDKIVVELKVGVRFKKRDYDQIKNYLVQSGLKLGVLVRFDESGVTFARVLPPSFVDL